MMYKIRYEHVVIVFGACIEPIFNAIIMEYMSLGSLYDVLHKQNDNITLTWLDRYSLSWQMAKSINYLHNLNPSWKTPELLISHQEHTKKTDIYNLGITMWELATGLKPWNEYVDETVIEVLIKIEERSKIPLDIPEEYKQAIEDSWNQDPSKRPSCFNLMEQMLKQMKNMKQIDELTTTAIDLHHQQKKTNLC
ncbi:unnamed protein product [Rotaria sp. Silwood1]|nr:unnamed protein product [Rotaria sp. Silwood1]CAF1181951.1 unnamed protein product [Rotaria sp. Silwood1]CAF3463126.1 unnamed protein product [Rotaria sp. Silwood1]CAF4999395.1 unnamed protein product [Rotaria sp. Silwood1]